MFWKKEDPPVIEFYCHPKMEGALPKPTRAAKHVAKWFKDIPAGIPHMPDQVGAPGMTAKKCMPMLDAMTVGYVIPLQAEVGIKTNHDCSMIEVKNCNELRAVEFHNLEQIGGKKAPGYPAPPMKFLNHWVIKTAPGWSTLFLPLVNDFNETRFTCLAGLVDTDTYAKEVNFPAVWHTPDYDDHLPAGLPLVVAIPIHRSMLNDIKDPPIRPMTDQEFKDIERIRIGQSSRRGVYTNELRDPRK